MNKVLLPVECAKEVNEEEKVGVVRALKRNGLTPHVLPISQRRSLVTIHIPRKGMARWIKRHKRVMSQLNFPRFMPEKTENPIKEV